MSIEAQSADGTKHVFPDGTPDAVVDRVMKQYARSRLNAAPHADGPVTSFAKGIGAGAARGVFGAEQLAGKGLSALGFTETGKKLSDQGELANRAIDAAMKPDEATHPIASGAGKLTGAVLAPGGAAAKLVGGGMRGAAAAGALAGLTEPVDPGKNYLREKVGQVATGAATGAALGKAVDVLAPHVAQAVGKIADWAIAVHGPKVAEDPAAKAVMQRIAKDAKAGGPTAQDMLDLLIPAQKAGVPMAPVDVGGANVKALAGKVARAPGESRQVMSGFLDQRDAGAGDRLAGVVDRHIALGSAYKTAETLAQARSINARPLWDKAMSGGSLAPLQTQLEKQIASLGEREAAANKLVAKSQGYLGRLKKTDQSAKLFHQDNIATATKDLKAIAEERQAASELLAQARADGTANAPGAVWSPRLQEFLSEPDVQQGIRRGLKIERHLALAEGRPMNPREYAIVGNDGNGDPIIGTVPTMRLLQTAKEGIDRMLQTPEMRDPLTRRFTKDGIALDKLQKAFLAELDRLNPAYKAAREQWSGDTASREALEAGRDIFKKHPEEIAEEARKLNPNDMEFYRLGVAETVKTAINKTPLSSDEARSLIKSAYVKMQLRPIFENEQAFNRFVDAVTNERTMFATRSQVLGGSQTAARVAEDGTPLAEAGMHAAHGADHALKGNLLAALGKGMAAAKALGRRPDPQLDTAIARILTSTGPGGGVEVLRRAAATMPHTRNHLARALRQAAPYAGAAGQGPGNQ